MKTQAFVRRTLLALALSLSIPMIAVAGQHLKITKELFVEATLNGGVKGVLPPNSISKSRDGGYVITGGNAPWAIKVDRNGITEWAYSASFPNFDYGAFYGAVELPDDSFILCGASTTSIGHNVDEFGLVTHVDKRGKVIEQKVMYPDDPDFRIWAQLSHCTRTEEGVALFGAVAYMSSKGRRHPESWLVLLDNQGNIVANRTFGESLGYAPSGEMLPDKGFVIASPSGGLGHVSIEVTDIVRLDSKGEIIRGTVELPYRGLKVASPKGAAPLQIVAFEMGNYTKLLGLDLDLNTISIKETHVRPILTSATAAVTGNTFLLAGSFSRRGEYISAVQWVSFDTDEEETLTFSRLDESIKVSAVIPTGEPGEFVCARDIFATVPPQIGQNERAGLALTFIQVK